MRPETPAVHSPGGAQRPGSFSGVVAQEQAVTETQAFIASLLNASVPGQQAVIFEGPPGVGKTTLARLLGKSLQCTAPGTLEPCCACDSCKAFAAQPFAGHPDFIEFSAAERSGVLSMSDLSGLMAVTPFGQWRIGFVDEAHALSPLGQDVLLKAIEEAERFAVFVFATTKLDKLSPTLRSRCRLIRLRPPRHADRLALLRARCSERGLHLAADELDALELLAERSGPSNRELVHDLDRLLAQGPVSLEAVEALLPADALVPGFKCLECLLADDLAGAIAHLSAWPGSPNWKREQIQRLLLNLSLRDVHGLDLQPDPLRFVSVVRRRALIARFDERRNRAGAVSLSLSTYLEDGARCLGGEPAAVGETDLVLRLTRFHEQLSAPRCATAPSVGTGPATDVPRGRRARRIPAGPEPSPVVRHRLEQAPSVYLDRVQAGTICRAASFLIQAYGTCLNVTVTFAHRYLGTGGEAAASSTLADFARTAKQRLQRRGQPTFAFLYVHETDPRHGLVTRFAAHVEPRCLGEFEAWAQARFASAPSVTEVPGLTVHTCYGGGGERLAFHHAALRGLLGGVDPLVYDWDETGRRRPLRDLLGLKGPAIPLGAPDRRQLWGRSDTLGPEAQAAAARDGMDFLDAVADRAWSSFVTGWELDEHRDREAERAARADGQARIDALWPPTESLVEPHREAALARLRARLTLPAKSRPRSWTGWWADP